MNQDPNSQTPTQQISDPLIHLLMVHMRVAVEDNNAIKCWCGERFPSGDAHRIHVAELIRELIKQEVRDGNV